MTIMHATLPLRVCAGAGGWMKPNELLYIWILERRLVFFFFGVGD